MNIQCSICYGILITGDWQNTTRSSHWQCYGLLWSSRGHGLPKNVTQVSFEFGPLHDLPSVHIRTSVSCTYRIPSLVSYYEVGVNYRHWDDHGTTHGVWLCRYGSSCYRFGSMIQCKFEFRFGELCRLNCGSDRNTLPGDDLCRANVCTGCPEKKRILSFSAII